MFVIQGSGSDEMKDVYLEITPFPIQSRHQVKGLFCPIKNILLLLFCETSPLSSISYLYIYDLHVCWWHFTLYLHQYLVKSPVVLSQTTFCPPWVVLCFS